MCVLVGGWIPSQTPTNKNYKNPQINANLPWNMHISYTHLKDSHVLMWTSYTNQR